MSSQELTLQDGASLEKGDWIVHQQHGVGEVRAIDKKTLGGKERKYFRVKTKKGGTYWLPVNKKPDYIRFISPRSQIEKTLKLISETPESLPKNYKSRNSFIAEKLSEADIYTKAEVIRDLHARGAQEDVNLTVIDSRRLDKLREQLLREMVVALEIEMSEAEAKLERALKKSVSKMS